MKLSEKREYTDALFKIIVIIFIIYILIKIYKYFKHRKKVNYLLNHRKKIEIDLKKALSVKEYVIKRSSKNDNPLSAFKDDGLIGVSHLETNYYSIIAIDYEIENKQYTHYVKIKMRKIEIYKKLKNLNTIVLLCDEKKPQNCVLDLLFLSEDKF